MDQCVNHPIVQLFSRINGGEAEPALVNAFEAQFEFSQIALLLWLGCVRQEDHYHFPLGLKAKWKGRCSGRLDNRMRNGPPNSAFFLGGGTKPRDWELDHIYDLEPLWSVRNGLHFTQSAGLVAMTHDDHKRRHSDATFSWLIRGYAFLKFGYDPLVVFSTEIHDQFGFVTGRSCELFWPEPTKNDSDDIGNRTDSTIT
jgi:hypothetical protein